MTDWDKFFKTYDAKVETYTQADIQEVEERRKELKKKGYLVSMKRFPSSHGYYFSTIILRIIKTKKGKRGIKKEKLDWLRF